MHTIPEPELKKIHEQLSALARQYQLRDRSAPLMSGLSVSQTYAITSLNRLGPMKMSALASELNMSLGAATKVADELERLNLVERISSQKDGRVQMIRSTRKGKNIFQGIHEAFLAHLAETLSPIPRSELAAVTNGLKVINQAVAAWQQKLKEGQK